jgi:hypothetical protein
MDRRPQIDAALAAFGLPAVVTVPAGLPVETEAFWLAPSTEQVPAGTDFRRAEMQRVLVLPLTDVPQVPRGTIVNIAPFQGGAPADWEVDSFERLDSDHYRVVVVPYEQPT